ncbi:MAG: hypothetical protein IJU03_13040 [Thermoguttaceae bacterium]|nr:hypothetical protein [Thermoguttaceae bacterium]
MKLTRLFLASAFAAGALLLCATSGYAAEKYTESGRASDVWSGYWWSMAKSDQPGELFERLRKYDAATHKSAEQWQRENRFKNLNGNEKIPGWWGYCQGFTASAIMENEPTGPVKYRGATFSVGDQKALLALSHAADVANVIGARYNGPGDDKDDISPALLIQTLRIYLKDNGAPIALDLHADESVNNCPVVAYSVDAEIDGDVCEGKLEITVAASPEKQDGGVDYDYVGLIEVEYSYTFRIAVENGSFLLNDSEWTGDSKDNHPDFAWSPFVVRPESPEIDYFIVEQIVAGCDESDPTHSVGGDLVEEENETFVQVREEQIQEIAELDELAQREQEEYQPVSDDLNPTVPTIALDVTPTNPTLALDKEAISLPAAFEFLRSGDSAWDFDITVDQFDGGYYGAGERYSIRGKSAKDGYVYLVGYYMDLKEGRTVFMTDVNDGKGYAVKAGEVFEITPKNPLPNELGEYRVRAVVTEKPLAFASLPAQKIQVPTQQAQRIPAQIQQAETKTLIPPQMQRQASAQRQTTQAQSTPKQKAPQRVVVPKVLFSLLRATGDFAQDQVAFVVVDKDEIDSFRTTDEESDKVKDNVEIVQTFIGKKTTR